MHVLGIDLGNEDSACAQFTDLAASVKEIQANILDVRDAGIELILLRKYADV